jgi:hypothetical protein
MNNSFLVGIEAAAKARKPAKGLNDLENLLENKRKAGVANVAGLKSVIREVDDCASELEKLRTSNPYRDALIKIGRIDIVADIELGSLKTEEEIRAKLEELMTSGDTESKFYELLSSKVSKMDEEAKKKEVDEFKKDENEKMKNKAAYENMRIYIKKNKIADAGDLTSLFELPEKEAKDKIKAPLPIYIDNVLNLIKRKNPAEKDVYRALFYLLPDNFGGTNKVANEEKRVYIYDKIKEPKVRTDLRSVANKVSTKVRTKFGRRRTRKSKKRKSLKKRR